MKKNKFKKIFPFFFLKYFSFIKSKNTLEKNPLLFRDSQEPIYIYIYIYIYPFFTKNKYPHKNSQFIINAIIGTI